MENWIKTLLIKSTDNITRKQIKSTKRCLLDTLGVMYKGSTYPNIKPLVSITNSSIRGSYAIGIGELESSDAALCNSTAAHSVELDDFFREGSVHPGVVVIPTALSVGQEVGASGLSLVKSIIFGYEIIGRIGMSSLGTLYDRGFHPTSICGVYGAAAVASFLYKLSPTQMNMALGIAGNYSSGLMAYKSNGAWTKRLNAGWAAKTGILSAKLAKQGFVGPDDILKGRYGFSYAFCEDFDEGVIDSDDNRMYVIDLISFKPYSSCRFTHSPIDALLNILQENNIRPKDINSITVYTHETAIKATMKPEKRKYKPLSTVDAQFSIPFCLGVALRYGKVMPDMFEGDSILDNNTLSLAAKVKAHEDGRFTKLFPKHNACQVIVETNRNTYSKEVYNSKGDPENPMSDKDLEEKFLYLSSGLLSEKKQSDVINIVKNIDQYDNIVMLTEKFMI